MSGIATVTGTVVNITHNGDNHFNLGDEEFDGLLIAVTKSQVMSPARKKAYARLEFLERKNAARNAEMKQARNGRADAKRAKQTANDSQVGLGEQLFCSLHMSKRCEQVARNFYAATTQMGTPADAEAQFIRLLQIELLMLAAASVLPRINQQDSFHSAKKLRVAAYTKRLKKYYGGTIWR